MNFHYVRLELNRQVIDRKCYSWSSYSSFFSLFRSVDPDTLSFLIAINSFAQEPNSLDKHS